jgi:uncharacterized protein
MRLYAGASTTFVTLNMNGQLAEHLRQEFFSAFGYYPSQNEVMSWRNSLLRISLVFQQANLNDHGVFVEYQLPLSSKRIDVIVCGKDDQGVKNSVIIELKQWERCKVTDYDSDYVVTWVAGGNRPVLHPSVQVGNYKYYIQDNVSAFYEGKNPVHLYACSYLHNYNCYDNDPLFDVRFRAALDKFPAYTADDTAELAAFLVNRLSAGDGMGILTEIENSKLRPSKKLLNQVSTAIKEKLTGELRMFGNLKSSTDYILLDEQLVVYDTVMSIIKRGLLDKQKHAIIVKGGAGTGKSVIGLQLLADLTALGKNTHYATGSKSFTETLRKIIGGGANSLFKYFMSYGAALPNEIDVLLMDEAHRIRERTGYPFKATGNLQIVDLLKAAKVSVFFIDDYQVVRKGEIGSSAFIRENALEQNCKIYEYELEAQFRCGGSDGYTNWIDNTLQIRRTANALWTPDPNFELKIFKSPEELELAIRRKSEEGFSARMTAGFCWPWSNELYPDGSLIEDVQIGNYKRPWNAREDLTGMKKGIPKSQFWAYDPKGIDQVGCVYTAQGFEFDYAGVIVGTDLIYNPNTGAWEGHSENSYDTQVKSSTDFLQLVKNTYRVLLTRGMKGCYIYFMDKNTEAFVRSRIDFNPPEQN